MDPINNVSREGQMHDEETVQSVARPEETLRDELVHDIPNEDTLAGIAAKLPRRAYEVESSLSSDWQRALEGRMIYDAQVVTSAREEFLLVSCHFLTNVSHCISDDESRVLTVEKRTLSLFSPSEKRWYNIPPIPGCHEGVLHNEYAQAISDGSLYLVGGTKSRKTFPIPSAEVLVLDLAKYPLEWRQCANMKVARLYPTVRVMHGKIFVFGGYASSGDTQLGESQFQLRNEFRNEVYDPTDDTWSFIAPPRPLLSIDIAVSVGQQFFACVGSTPIDPVQKFFDKDLGTKFVVRVDDILPTIKSTEDPDAKDDMDGLHEIINKELGYGPIVPANGNPTERFASTIRHCDESRPGSVFLFYDPVTDEWRQFDKEELKTATVDEYLPRWCMLRGHGDGSDQEDDGSEPEDDVTVYVRSISL